ncbi:MAG TPA: hypothetical protein VHV08_09485, partial [Pirellulales bacterium]|nr:hypothetical protein [Pirellulales bacterium]
MAKCLTFAVLLLLSGQGLMGAEYRIEPIKEAPPSDLAADIVAQLSPSGFKIMQGEKRTLYEIWPAKKWDVRADFKPSDTILYPLVPGSLVGAVRLARKGA